MGGIATSSRSSGRLEDLLYSYSTYKYDTIIENTEKMEAVALDLARRIMIKVPKMLPVTVNASVIKGGERVREEETIKKEDLQEEHTIKVQLAAADPVEEDRTALLYGNYFDRGLIDDVETLMKGLNMTREEALDMVIRRYVYEIKRDPMFRGYVARKTMEAIGGDEYLDFLKQSAEEQQQMATALQQQATQTGTPQMGEPRKLNLDWNNPETLRMADVILSQRKQRQPPAPTGIR